MEDTVARRQPPPQARLTRRVDVVEHGGPVRSCARSGARGGFGAKALGWLDARLPVLFLVPGLACLCLVIVYPVVYNLVVAFTDASLMYPGAAFVGLENFQVTLDRSALLDGGVAHAAMDGVSVAGQLLLGLIAALALERVTVGRATFRLA